MENTKVGMKLIAYENHSLRPLFKTDSMHEKEALRAKVAEEETLGLKHLFDDYNQHSSKLFRLTPLALI
jgi:hypothetical protein